MLSIISTVGTTVFGRFGDPLNIAASEFEKSSPEGIDRIAYAKSFPGHEIYVQALAEMKAKSGVFLRRAYAEINAIEGIHDEAKSSRNNRYHFLASHTAKGILAARVLSDYCREAYDASDTSVEVIQGLQVDDASSFRSTGLPYLVQTVYRLIDDARRDHFKPIINPTGGFKAAIPYLTLVGMLRQKIGVRISLIHESSQQLITLSGLPIALDIEAIQEIAPLLRECEEQRQTGLSRDKLMKGLELTKNQSVEDHDLWSLFEELDGYYILSGLGSIALAEVTARTRLSEVWLSRQALERLEKDFKSGSTARKNFETIFERLSDPDNRVEPYRHQYKGTTFPAFKYKGNERLFYHERDNGQVWVLELAQHIGDNDWSYDRIPTKISDYLPVTKWTGK